MPSELQVSQRAKRSTFGSEHVYVRMYVVLCIYAKLPRARGGWLVFVSYYSTAAGYIIALRRIRHQDLL